MHRTPRQSELPAVKRQKRWILISYGCLVLMMANLFSGQAVPVLQFVIFLLFCIAMAARASLVVQDGVFIMTSLIRDYAASGGYGLALAFIRLVAETVVGVLLLIAVT